MSSIECPNCHKKMKREQIVRLLWKKADKELFGCPYCIRDLMKREIKELDIDKKLLGSLDEEENTEQMQRLKINAILEQWNLDNFNSF